MSGARFDAVIFDLDGTLLDTLADLADSVNAALRRWGHPEYPVTAYKTLVGDGVRNLVSRAFPNDSASEEKLGSAIEAVREEYRKRWDKQTAPYPGIPEMLDSVAKRGLPTAILSNKPQDFTELNVQKFLGRWQFKIVRGAVPGIPLKPDPHAAKKIAADLGVSPGRIAYVGDTSTDMKTAVAAGMHPIGVLWGFREEAELRLSGARDLIEKPEQLPPLL